MTVFSKNWFALHQKKLLWLLNTPIIKVWFRYVLRINGKRSDVGKKKIVGIMPNAISWEKEGEYVSEFRTHDKFAKRLYYAFKPLWYMFHLWDMATKFKPEWNLGFDSLTVYPDANPESTSIDGYVRNNGAVYSTVRDATSGSTVSHNGAVLNCIATLNGATYYIDRLIALFDTSALTGDATISAATCSFNGVAMTADSSFNIRLVSSSPALDTTLSTGDFDTLGTTGYASDYPDTSYQDEAYNDMALNATGRAAISKTGITKFGLRNVEFDIDNSAPTNAHDMQFDSADAAGTTTDPKLVITYAFLTGAKNMLLLGVG